MEDLKRTAERSAVSAMVPPQYAGYMDDVVRKIVAKGNDVEIRTCKEGLKVLEVSKRVAAVIPKD